MSEAAEAVDVPELDIDPYSMEVLRDPYPFHENLRNTGAVVHIKPHGVYAVGRYAESKIILADYARFTTSAGIGIQDIRKPGDFRVPNRMLEVDPPVHTAIRAVVQRALNPMVVRKWKEGFDAKAAALVDKLLDVREFDAVEHLAEAFVLSAFPDAVGVRLPRTETLAIGEMRFNQSGPKNELYFRAMERAQPYLEWFERTIQRDAVLPGSIAEQLFKAEDAGELDQGVASNMCRSFVGGGTDSTIAGIGFTLNQLAQHPGEWTKVHAEPARAKAAFEEGIRFECPFQVTYRTVVSDLEFAGMRLKKDTKIGVFFGAANRDPRYWSHPDRYDIDRPQLAGNHLALGTGAHACIGQMIARLEAEAVIGALARKVKTIEPTATATYRPINQMRTLDKLPVRITAA